MTIDYFRLSDTTILSLANIDQLSHPTNERRTSTMPVKSLTALCMQKILNNISLVSSIGDELPHDNRHVQKILSRITSANQLRQMELNSPQLQGHTEKYWRELIRRDFLGARKKNYIPSDPTGWWKVYKRYKKEDDAASAAANAALKSAFNDIAAEKEKNVSLLISRSQLPRAPRTGRAYGTRQRGKAKEDTSSLRFNAGSRTKLNSGKNVLKRARREARDVAAQHGALGNMSRVGAGASRLKAAPASLLEYNRVASQPDYRTPAGPSTESPAHDKHQLSPPNGFKDDLPEPVIIDVTDDDYSDALFDDADEQPPPAKKPRLGTGRRGLPPKDPLFDSESDENSKSREPPAKPRMKKNGLGLPSSHPAPPKRKARELYDSDAEEDLKMKQPPAKRAMTKGKAVAPSQAAPVKRKGPLLPGKPGAGRFLNLPSTTSSTKAAAPQKPPQVKPSQASPPPARSSSATKSVNPASGRSASPPQDKPGVEGSPASVQLGPPRKKKVDIFMKPRRRP